MSKKAGTIPVQSLNKEFEKGIAVGRMSSGNFRSPDEAQHSHRHDFHIFILQIKGTSFYEIDFEKRQLNKSAILYIHPNQVHRFVNVKNADFYLLAISNDNLNAAYLKMLDDLTPAQSLTLPADDLAVFIQSISLCTTLFERKADKPQLSLLRDSCNTFVGLFVSQYAGQLKPVEGFSRFEEINRAFKLALDKHFIEYKRPSDYAGILNISASYLNECVRNITGFPVSYHIQQRVILEARRLLYHSGKSVKEIADELGYDDYPYFCRLFTKVTGMTALVFRNKNRD
jgi:AraC family transcriptional activator of pobA